MPTPLLLLLATGYGLLAGLLVPRAAHRLSVEPDRPWRGDCPSGHGAGGWVGLARCGRCGDGGWYGPSTVLTAGAGGGACAVLALATGARTELLVWLAVVPFALVLGLVDAAVHRLPDVLTLPLAAGMLTALGLAAAAGATTGSWSRALLGALALGGFYLLLVLVDPDGMGPGDAKLALVLGGALGWYGWDVLVAGAFLGMLLGAVYGLGLVLTRRAGRKATVPMGPFMLAGAFAALLLGAAGT